MSVPIAVYSLPVKGENVPAVDEQTDSSVHLTMASIDPSEKSNKPVSLKVTVIPKVFADEEVDDDEMKEFLEENKQEFILCTLKPGLIYQQPLDFSFGFQETVTFSAIGGSTIYLSGSFMVSDEPSDDEDDDEEESDYDLSPDEDELVETLSDEEEQASDDSEEEEEDSLDDIKEEKPKKSAAKTAGKKRQQREEAADDNEMEVEEPEAAAKPAKGNKKQKAEPAKEKKVAFAEKLEQGPTGPAAKKEKQPAASSEKKTQNLKGGVVATDYKVGGGAVATNGKKVEMRYIGKLQNGKVFDKNTKGKPFSFLLGRGEVIKGWDVGVLGMAEGGERKLTIPASMAYGNQNIPGIPKNSTLIFEVKLLKVHK
ncbi:FKBP-type peptidyl-prolyl cis-trans isomerase [Schizosaccharomyces japonicus yFS275]|uniref:FK506-binding protein n=1 Tax=Schizosaccharomyces japonicus (strain yFS275 / FY16936) TaxID=402676 RepID=B6K5D3_SCHJY|nr:FKBP-type peptidyl-prolyl cis-trans isomerase [Schizosaccharomyces japonicus yFS275]EEB08737.1 FKBP-type peptidyl-prolyl cis-trans isomerase [Schizosaccharomyces japonicus yFS275]